MLNFLFLAHGALGWSDEILLAVVLAAILCYGVGIWFAGRRVAENHSDAEPEHLTLD